MISGGVNKLNRNQIHHKQKLYQKMATTTTAAAAAPSRRNIKVVGFCYYNIWGICSVD